MGAWWWWRGHGWSMVRCGLHGVALDDPWRPWVSYEVCGLHVGERVRVGCARVSCVGFVSAWKGGMGCMLWPWGACGLPMGCVCAVREVRAACGGHGAMGCKRGTSCMWVSMWGWGVHYWKGKDSNPIQVANNGHDPGFFIAGEAAEVSTPLIELKNHSTFLINPQKHTKYAGLLHTHPSDQHF